MFPGIVWFSLFPVLIRGWSIVYTVWFKKDAPPAYINSHGCTLTGVKNNGWCVHRPNCNRRTLNVAAFLWNLLCASNCIAVNGGHFQHLNEQFCIWCLVKHTVYYSQRLIQKEKRAISNFCDLFSLPELCLCYVWLTLICRLNRRLPIVIVDCFQVSRTIA